MENGMVLRDRSIYARHAPLIGSPTWTIPRPGNAEASLSLDYTNTLARYQTIPPVPFPATMAVWAYWNGGNSGDEKRPIIHTDYDSGLVGGYGLELWGAVGNWLNLRCPTGGTSAYYANLVPSSGVWFFAGFSCQGGTGDAVNLYLNRATSTAQTTWTADNHYLPNGPTYFVNDLLIGYHFPGYVAEAMWWSRALSTAEMLQLADPHFSILNALTPRKYFVAAAPAGNPWNAYAQQ